MELAHAPGDQLGELAAEVEDDDGVGLGAARLAAGERAPGQVQVRAWRGRRVEGDLQVRLDLGVVGRQDAVARVGRLTVDGLAALARGRVTGVLAGRRSAFVQAWLRCRVRLGPALLLRVAQSPPSLHPVVPGSLPAGGRRRRAGAVGGSLGVRGG